MSDEEAKPQGRWRKIAAWVVGAPVALLAALVVIGMLVPPPGPRSTEAAIGACEMLVRASLRTPESYKRVGEKALQYDDRMMVDVVYDASNMFGAIVRYTTTCRFESWTDDT